jgi:predicted aspartyl protease
MIRFKYITQFRPSAPFVYVTIRTADGASEIGELPAQLDTAADRTVVPMKVVDELAVEPMGNIPIGGVAGHVTLMPTFLVQVEIRLLRSVNVAVVAHREEPFVLLGRDVLNQFRVSLDGPGEVVEIE